MCIDGSQVQVPPQQRGETSFKDIEEESEKSVVNSELMEELRVEIVGAFHRLNCLSVIG